MKMVDGSTVRHGRVDCSYPERVRCTQCRGQRRGEENDRNEGTGGKELKGGESRERNVGGFVNFPLGCSETGERRRKHSRKKSVRPFTHFSIHTVSGFTGGEAEPEGTESHPKTCCGTMLVGIPLVFLDDRYGGIGFNAPLPLISTIKH